MKTNDKWFIIIYIITIVFLIAFMPQQKIIVNNRKEGFWGAIKKAYKKVTKKVATAIVTSPIIKPVAAWFCNPACQAIKKASADLLERVRKAREERERKAREAAERERLRKILQAKIQKCTSDGGAWHNTQNKCYYKRKLPGNINKPRPQPLSPPPPQRFCDKDPNYIREQCNIFGNKGSCDRMGCCGWCESKKKCVSYANNHNTLSNTLEYLEC